MGTKRHKSAPRRKARTGARSSTSPPAPPLLPPKPPRGSVPREVAQWRARPLAALWAGWGRAGAPWPPGPGCSPLPVAPSPSPGPGAPPRALPLSSPLLPSLPCRPGPASSSCAHSLSQRRAPRSRSAAKGRRQPLPSALTAGSGAPAPSPRRRDTPPPLLRSASSRRTHRAADGGESRRARRRAAAAAAAREARGARQAHGEPPGAHGARVPSRTVPAPGPYPWAPEAGAAARRAGVAGGPGTREAGEEAGARPG